MKFTSTIIAALLATAAAPAMAGSLAAPEMENQVYTPPAADAYLMPAEEIADWGGLYAGLSVGATSQTGPDGSGFELGLLAGYNMDLGSVVVGVEGEYSPMGYDLDAGAGKMKGAFGANLRAGYDLGSILPYATVGIKSATANFGAGDVSDTGTQFGLGADYMVTDMLVVGGEFTKTSFSDFDGTGNDVDQTNFGARVSMKF